MALAEPRPDKDDVIRTLRVKLEKRDARWLHVFNKLTGAGFSESEAAVAASMTIFGSAVAGILIASLR